MGLWDQDWLRRSPSSEMDDHWSKTELDEMLKPNQSLYGDDLDNWVNPWGGSYDPDDLYGNLDFTPPFAGGAGEGASDKWQVPGVHGTGGDDEEKRLNDQCGADGSGRVWDPVSQRCVDPTEAKNTTTTGTTATPDYAQGYGKTWADFDPTLSQYPGVPGYQGPDIPELSDFDYKAWEPPDEFRAPTMEEAQAAPGFQMRMEQGRKALEASAAAKGITHSGQTQTDLINYGQRMGEMGYQDVYGRRASEYDRMRSGRERDYQTGYGRARDIYDIGRQNVLGTYGMERDEARDRYAPQFAEWQAQTRATELDRDWERKSAWDEYRLDEDRWERDWARKKAFETYNAYGAGTPQGPSYMPAPSAFFPRR